MSPVIPSFKLDAFSCPHCGAFAQQDWNEITDFNYVDPKKTGYAYCTCAVCERMSFWHLTEMVYPVSNNSPESHADMPSDVKQDYDEARAIEPFSSRGAAALLRLCVQKLCKELGESGTSINDDIASLVAKGLDERIQQALDIVRVTGNEAVHPGELDLRDDPELAQALFILVNEIIEELIGKPKRINSWYAKLPPSKLKAIENRDSSKAGP